MWVTSSAENVLTPTAVALGNFDGVHRGHQQVIKALYADTTSQSLLSQQLISAPDRQSTSQEIPHIHLSVVTFDPHPQEFFSGQPRTLLTPLDEKVQQLAAIGVEQFILLPFNQELACLSPQAFVEEILVRQLRTRFISVGFNFCFGHRRSGTAADLTAIAAKYDIQVQIAPPQSHAGERISSSAIRQALQVGNLEQANRLLGRAYTLMGTVVEGQRLGRTLGFPTANLQVPTEKFLPCQGVYAVKVTGSSLEASQIGVMNIGFRPTVNGMSQTLEVHLLDWFGDLYGQTLTVSLEQFLRSEQKFSTLEELKLQIQADCASARSLLKTVA